MSDCIRPKTRVIFLYLLLPLALFAYAVLIPMGQALYYSLFDWNAGISKSFIGLDNYAELLKDNVFWEAFGHNVYLVVACVIGQIGLAFVFVMMMSSKKVILKGLHRTVTFFPSTISAVSVGLIWRMVFDYKYGLINYMYRLFNIGDGIVWLNEKDSIMLVTSIPLIWQYIGYYMIILLSAISAIDKDIFEVAELDGANALQRAVYITFPLIRNTIMVCLTLCIAGNMKAFDHIFTMTKGGPGNASNVMSLYAYTVSFQHNRKGYGSTISVGILVLSLSIILAAQLISGYLSKEKVGTDE